MKEISIIIPVYNEENNIQPLHNKLQEVLNNLKEDHEIIFIDDASTDNTLNKLNQLKKQNKNLKIISHSSNLGQSAALTTGFKQASGKIIITMDGDLQNDPEDIPNLIDKLNQGHDVVCGWRYNRQDSAIIKKIPSKLANFIVRKTTKIKIHDVSCTLRAYKNHTIKNLELFKGAHRLIPVILSKRGFKITEVKTNHKPRLYDQPKYNSPFRVFECIQGLRKVMKEY